MNCDICNRVTIIEKCDACGNNVCSKCIYYVRCEQCKKGSYGYGDIKNTFCHPNQMGTKDAPSQREVQRFCSQCYDVIKGNN